MVTIYDIARATGYSAPTVSKALNGQTDIAAKTRKKIEDMAREMGYIPNLHAKSLVTKKSWLVGVIYQEADVGQGLEHPLFSGILNSFKTAIESHGYELMFISHNLGPRSSSYLDHIRYRTVEGVLVLNTDEESCEIDKILSENVPLVSSNQLFPGAINVVSENYHSSVEAVDYLVGLGHRCIAHISGPESPYANAATERRRGFETGMAKHGLEIIPGHVIEAEHWNPGAAYRCMQELLKHPVRPTALYMGSDLLSYGVYQACEEAGICIPEDLSIISFDDNQTSTFISPPLTTFRQDRALIGQAAANLLVKCMRGELAAPHEERIPVRLVERASCRALGTR